MNYKTTTILTCLALFITLSAFTPVADFGKRKHLIGKWMPKKIKIGENIKTFEDGDGDSSLEFLKNGKYIKDGGKGRDAEGKWELSKNGKKLTMEGGKFNGAWTIDELNNKLCTISLTKDIDNIVTIFLVPYKKKKD